MRVDTHDFPDRELGRAVPYGIYDVAANTGWVNVGTDHDTAAFAVESIRRWWNGAGRATYPTAGRLLITADAGGSNGCRTRTWKTELSLQGDESVDCFVSLRVTSRRPTGRIRQRALTGSNQPTVSESAGVRSGAISWPPADLRRRSFLQAPVSQPDTDRPAAGSSPRCSMKKP